MLDLAGIVSDSIVDGPGYRFTVFVQGCPHGCPGCHNPQTHDIVGGYEADTEELLKELAANTLEQGITLSGGEPFCQCDAMIERAYHLIRDFYDDSIWERCKEQRLKEYREVYHKVGLDEYKPCI